MKTTCACVVAVCVLMCGCAASDSSPPVTTAPAQQPPPAPSPAQAARQPSRPSANRSDSNGSHFHNRADDSAAIDRACHGDAVLMKTKHTVNEDEQP